MINHAFNILLPKEKNKEICGKIVSDTKSTEKYKSNHLLHGPQESHIFKNRKTFRKVFKRIQDDTKMKVRAIWVQGPQKEVKEENDEKLKKSEHGKLQVWGKNIGELKCHSIFPESLESWSSWKSYYLELERKKNINFKNKMAIDFGKHICTFRFYGSLKSLPFGKVFASGLPDSANDFQIKHHFSKFGSIQKIEMLDIYPGFCFVVFEDLNGLKLALMDSQHSFATENCEIQTIIEIKIVDR